MTGSAGSFGSDVVRGGQWAPDFAPRDALRPKYRQRHPTDKYAAQNGGLILATIQTCQLRPDIGRFLSVGCFVSVGYRQRNRQRTATLTLAAISPPAPGGRTVEPVTEEDF